MKSKESFYQSLIDNIYDGVYFVDQSGVVTYWNEGATRVTGLERHEVEGKACTDSMLLHLSAKGKPLTGERCPVLKALGSGKTHEIEAYVHHKEGHNVRVLLRAAPIRNEQDEIVGAIEVFSDDSRLLEDRQRIEELSRIAMIDPVTAIGNRRYTEITLNTKLEELNRYGWTCGILFFDIDHFKSVNDTYGHQAGDAVLGMVARTLENSLRSFDFVGRFGGEEFVAVLTNVEHSGLSAIAERCRSLMESAEMVWEGKPIKVTVSIGGTLATPGEPMEDLLARADRLMYASKTAGRNNVTIADPPTDSGEKE